MNWDPDFLYFPDCGDGVLIMRKKQQAVVVFLERVEWNDDCRKLATLASRLLIFVLFCSWNSMIALVSPEFCILIKPVAFFIFQH